MADRDSGQDSLLKEIDEELRQENYAQLWKKYGNYVIALGILLIVGVAGYQAWHSYDLERRGKDSALFSNALRAAQDEKSDDASAMLSKLTESGSSGYTQLARIDKATLQARGGDKKAAGDALLALSHDQSIDQNLRDLALLLSALQQIDSGDPQELANRLAPLTAAGNPWRHSAKELSALLAERTGDTQKATQLFHELSDDATAPSGIRARAAEMSAVLGG